jgi:hypothetical protein
MILRDNSASASEHSRYACWSLDVGIVGIVGMSTIFRVSASGFSAALAFSKII